jgi:hypothetical protein
VQEMREVSVVFKFILIVFLSFFTECFSSTQPMLGENQENNNGYLQIYDLYGAELTSDQESKFDSLFIVGVSQTTDIWKQKRFFSVWFKADADGNYPVFELSYSQRNIDFRRIQRAEALSKIEDAVSTLLGLTPKDNLFKDMLLLDSYQDENDAVSFMEKLISIISKEDYKTHYSHIQTALESWKDEIEDYKKFSCILTNACLKNKITNRYERVIPFIKGLAALLVPLVPFIWSLQAIKTTCYTQGESMTKPIEVFNEKYAGKVKVTSISDQNVTFNLLVAQSCYATSIAPYVYSSATLVLGVIMVFSDFFLNLHSIAYAWNLLFGVNIEKPSDVLIKRIFDQSKYVNKNEDQKKKFTDFASGVLPDLLKKRVTERRLLDVVDSIVSKHQ